MSSPLSIFVELCNTTDGRDKIYKTAGGLAKVMGNVPNPSQKKFAALSKAIGDGRSLMRMAKWTTNIQKLNAYVPKRDSIGLKEMVEMLRIIGDFGYVLGDNCQYLSKYGVLPLDTKATVLKSKIFQFVGFFCQVCLDMYAVYMACCSGATTKKQREALLNLIKNTADLLACLAALGYAKKYGYNPSASFTGMCSVVSGSIATYSNINKTADKLNAKKAK